MNFEEFLNNLGLHKGNPFQFTNADQEKDLLSNYFIKPDYFEDVWGDPYNLASNIIYAPRGGGKTAQRIMIENRALSFDDILTITYTNHDLSNYKSVNEINLIYHLTYLNRLLLLALFDKIIKKGVDLTFTYSHAERQFIYKISRIYLYDTPISFPKQAIHSIKTLDDYVIDGWNNFKQPIINILKQVSKVKGLEIDLTTEKVDKKLEMSHRDNFFNIVNLLKKAGYSSIYILIDKVDEQSLTGNNPQSSYRLIEDLLKDLELLETPNICFKFFLWDALKAHTVITARPDRVFSYELKWTWGQLREMLNKRIETYSDGKVTDFSTLFTDIKSLGRIILFSELSPRDTVRICNRILSEQFKSNPYSDKLETVIVNNSIELFCKEKSQELITNISNLNYLKKTNHVSFTIEELVSGKVASDSGAIRNIINPWQISGYLKKIGLVERKNAKAVNEYAVQDIRLAFVACPKLNIDDFITSKVRRCKETLCKTTYYRDFDRKEYACPECNTIN